VNKQDVQEVEMLVQGPSTASSERVVNILVGVCSKLVSHLADREVQRQQENQATQSRLDQLEAVLSALTTTTTTGHEAGSTYPATTSPIASEGTATTSTTKPRFSSSPESEQEGKEEGRLSGGDGSGAVLPPSSSSSSLTNALMDRLSRNEFAYVLGVGEKEGEEEEMRRGDEEEEYRDEDEEDKKRPTKRVELGGKIDVRGSSRSSSTSSSYSGSYQPAVTIAHRCNGVDDRAIKSSSNVMTSLSSSSSLHLMMPHSVMRTSDYNKEELGVWHAPRSRGGGSVF